MRSLLAAALSLFLPARGAHRAVAPPFPSARPPAPARLSMPRSPDVITADGQPLVRPYVVVWERERDERERLRLAALAQRCADRFPWGVAV